MLKTVLFKIFPSRSFHFLGLPKQDMEVNGEEKSAQ